MEDAMKNADLPQSWTIGLSRSEWSPRWFATIYDENGSVYCETSSGAGTRSTPMAALAEALSNTLEARGL